MNSAISCSITNGQPLLTKRVNIIYQNLINHTDIMARTTPATNDFIIPSV